MPDRPIDRSEGHQAHNHRKPPSGPPANAIRHSPPPAPARTVMVEVGRLAVDIARIATHAPVRDPFEPLGIAMDRCKGCGLCVDVCPKHCLALDTATVNALGYHPVQLTDASACTSCALCARICPDVVFSVYAPARGARS